MTNFELQQLRDLPIEGVAERLGLRVERHKCLCPFHDDHTPRLKFKNNKFKCWSCGESGGTIDLVMKLQNVGFKEACEWLGSDQFIVHSAESRVKSAPSVTFDAKKYEKYFQHPYLNESARHFLFEERKLDERVVRWCRLTSWRDRKNIPWLQIPYYNREGKLVGVQNRNLTAPSKPSRGKAYSHSPSGETEGGHPRFMFPRGSQCGIYNLPVLNLLKPGEDLYIAEGCSDCWSLLSAGHKAIAIPSATLLTQPLVEELSIINSQLSISLHMYPDRDLPGERLFLQLQKVLPNLQHHQLPPDCKDYSELYLKRNRPPLSPPSGGETGSGEAAAMSPPPYGQLPVGSGAIGERMRRRAKVRGGL